MAPKKKKARTKKRTPVRLDADQQAVLDEAIAAYTKTKTAHDFSGRMLSRIGVALAGKKFSVENEAGGNQIFRMPKGG